MPATSRQSRSCSRALRTVQLLKAMMLQQLLLAAHRSRQRRPQLELVALKLVPSVMPGCRCRTAAGAEDSVAGSGSWVFRDRDSHVRHQDA